MKFKHEGFPCQPVVPKILLKVIKALAGQGQIEFGAAFRPGAGSDQDGTRFACLCGLIHRLKFVQTIFRDRAAAL